MVVKLNSFPNGNKQLQIIINIKSQIFIFITCVTSTKIETCEVIVDFFLLEYALQIRVSGHSFLVSWDFTILKISVDLMDWFWLWESWLNDSLGPKIVPKLEPRSEFALKWVLRPEIALDMGLYTTFGIGKGWLDSHHLSSPSLLSPHEDGCPQSMLDFPQR